MRHSQLCFPRRRRFKPTPTVRRGAATSTSDTPGPADSVPPAADGGAASAFPFPGSATHPPHASAGEGGSSSAGEHAATARARDFSTRMEQEEWEKREKVRHLKALRACVCACGYLINVEPCQGSQVGRFGGCSTLVTNRTQSVSCHD